MDYTKVLSVTWTDTGEKRDFMLREPIRICAILRDVVEEEFPETITSPVRFYDPTPLDAQVEGPTIVEAIQCEHSKGEVADWLNPMPLHVFVGGDIQRKGRPCRWETMWAEVSIVDASGRVIA